MDGLPGPGDWIELDSDPGTSVLVESCRVHDDNSLILVGAYPDTGAVGAGLIPNDGFTFVCRAEPVNEP